jgi:hypothetical protein
MEKKPSLISLEGYRDLRPLNEDIVDITKPLMGQGLIAVELCGGILSATEALLRTGVKIRELHVCEIDPEARALAAARLEMLSKTFPELLAPKAFAHCFSSLPRHCIDQAPGRLSIGAYGLDHLWVSMSRLLTSLKKGTRTT